MAQLTDGRLSAMGTADKPGEWILRMGIPVDALALSGKLFPSSGVPTVGPGSGVPLPLQNAAVFEIKYELVAPNHHNSFYFCGKNLRIKRGELENFTTE